MEDHTFIEYDIKIICGIRIKTQPDNILIKLFMHIHTNTHISHTALNYDLDCDENKSSYNRSPKITMEI